MPDELPASPLSVVILGTDAVLAAAPATAVQLAHACMAAGYDAVVPASWGDELLATECLRRATTRGRDPMVCAVCPLVTERLLASGPELSQFAVSLVAPPVATARYLRAICGDDRVRITFVGACPGAADESLDNRIMPDEFLGQLTERGIVTTEQAQVFDSVIPPDRRRFQSLPGGVPTAEALWTAGGRTLIEIDDDDFVTDLAQRLISREHALLDVAPKLGCACSGAVARVAPRSARIAVAATEPPRSAMPVIDTTVPVDLVRTLPAAPRRREPVVPLAAEAPAPPPTIPKPVRSIPVRDRTGPRPASPSPASRGEPAAPGGIAAIEPAAPRRRSSGGTSARALVGGLPTVNSGEGRALPRAYVARRRSGRTPPDSEAIRPGSPRPVHAAERERPIESSVEPPRSVRAVPANASAKRLRMTELAAAARALVDRTVRDPRRLAVVVAVAIVASMLVGIVAGRWLVGATGAVPPSADTRDGATSPVGARTLSGEAPANRTIERGGAVGPELRPRTPTPAVRAAPSARQRRTAPDAARTGAAQRPAAPPATMQTSAAPAAPADSADSTDSTDSTGQEARTPAAPAPARTRQDSIDRELEAIARELQLRRARIDSIARRESLRTRPPR